MTIDPKKTGAPPRDIYVEEKKASWAPWLISAIIIAALIFALTQCDFGSERTAAPPPVVPVETVDTASRVVLPTEISSLGHFLGGMEPVPHTFVFVGLNFESGSSAIRSADRAELDTIAATLKQHPTARIRLLGYADARGAGGANATLGAARANSVKAALVERGVEAVRIETASGGERNPADTNTTAGGQAENRRTELIVTDR